MDQMTREMASLAREIGTLREARTTFMRELTSKVSDLRDGVQRMQTDFRNGREHMARTMKAESQAFLAELKHTVGDLEKRALGVRREFAADLAGARVAWSGHGSSVRVPVKKVEHSRKHKNKA
ncbi:MAG: hypothetical protein ABSA67_06305 [Candidatus Brocadiia bacterium]|jgi:hypothetical protein